LIDLVLFGSSHAVRRAFVDLQLGILSGMLQFGSFSLPHHDRESCQHGCDGLSIALRRLSIGLREEALANEGRSDFGDVDDCFSEGLRSFLRQVVPDAALDRPVLVSARKFLGIGGGVRVRRTVGVTFEGDGGH
jgi:hypothetical protein